MSATLRTSITLKTRAFKQMLVGAYPTRSCRAATASVPVDNSCGHISLLQCNSSTVTMLLHCLLPAATAQGFSGDFWREYHKLIPKAPLFEKRKDLYLLYHYLNHTNLFGGEACYNEALVPTIGAADVRAFEGFLSQQQAALCGFYVCMTQAPLNLLGAVAQGPEIHLQARLCSMHVMPWCSLNSKRYSAAAILARVKASS